MFTSLLSVSPITGKAPGGEAVCLVYPVPRIVHETEQEVGNYQKRKRKRERRRKRKEGRGGQGKKEGEEREGRRKVEKERRK